MDLQNFGLLHTLFDYVLLLAFFEFTLKKKTAEKRTLQIGQVTNRIFLTLLTSV